ncbi:hypothetical protein Tco_0363303 [Tanacetum coccineum]
MARLIQSNSQAQATSSMEKHTRYVGFALNTLTQLAQAVTSKNDSLAIRILPGSGDLVQVRAEGGLECSCKSAWHDRFVLLNSFVGKSTSTVSQSVSLFDMSAVREKSA